MKQRGFRYCSSCKNKLQKWGKTSAGKQRWRCPACSTTATKSRPDLHHAFVFRGFVSWLLSKASQDELGMPDRTFRDQTAWCWNVPVPSVLTGECHHCVIVDGIRVSDQICLIARTTMFVIAWTWVPYESSAYWATFLGSLPAPAYVVCDGQKGLLKAISLCWPRTVVQRCRFHIWLNVKAKLTLHPESIAGQELLALTKDLLCVRTRRQARHWKQRLKRWYKQHQNYVNERTIKPHPKPRERRWRYTHERLRSAYHQLTKVTDDVLRSSYRPHSELPSTTNHVEGGVNSQIRTRLKHHRGMESKHQRVLVNWYLYTRSEGRKPTRFCL
jgi:hypothetical protein